MTQRTHAVSRRLFSEQDHPMVVGLLEEHCYVKLPITQEWSDVQFERVWLAVLKLSGGDVGRLHEAIGVAQRDWRDVLVGAGFGQSLEAHHRWASELTS